MYGRRLLDTVKNKYHRYTWTPLIINNIINDTVRSKYPVIKTSNDMEDIMEAIYEIDGDIEVPKFVPDGIVRIRNSKGKYQFLVSWEDSDKTWEDVTRFYEDVPQLVKEYLKSNYSAYSYEVQNILGISQETRL